MAVPKRRKSKSRKGMRRSHDALVFNVALVKCDQCGTAKPRHAVCPECGTYKKQQVLSVGAD